MAVMEKPFRNTKKDSGNISSGWKKCRDGEKLSYEWLVSLVAI